MRKTTKAPAVPEAKSATTAAIETTAAISGSPGELTGTDPSGEKGGTNRYLLPSVPESGKNDGWIPQGDGTPVYDMTDKLPPEEHERIVSEADALGITPTEHFTALVREGRARIEEAAKEAGADPGRLIAALVRLDAKERAESEAGDGAAPAETTDTGDRIKSIWTDSDTGCVNIRWRELLDEMPRGVRVNAFRLAAMTRLGVREYLLKQIQGNLRAIGEEKARKRKYTVALNPSAAKQLESAAALVDETPENLLRMMTRLLPGQEETMDVAEGLESRLDGDGDLPELTPLTDAEFAALEQLEAMGMTREGLERQALKAVLRSFAEHEAIALPLTVVPPKAA